MFLRSAMPPPSLPGSARLLAFAIRGQRSCRFRSHHRRYLRREKPLDAPVDRGLKAGEVFYVTPQGKKEETGEYQAAVLAAAEHPKCRVLGAVIGTIDQNMHQTDMGTSWMHSMVRNWARGGGLQKILERLLERGFEVYLTADHGNVWGRGIGKPKVGSGARQRGERAHLFDSELIRAAVHAEFPGSLEWPRHGLPADLWALLAPDRACFRAKGQAAVSHGGIALEEVVVPFVHVRREP